MATRKSRETRAQSSYAVEVNGYKSLFTSLFCAAFEFRGIDKKDGLTSAYIARVLYERGAIAYDKVTGLFLKYTGVGRPNAYGEPREVRMYGADGVVITRKRDDVYLFKANPTAYPFARIIGKKCEFLADCDNAIAQNLDAVKSMTIGVTDSGIVADILAAINRRRIAGESYATVCPSSWGGDDNEVAVANATLSQLTTLTTGAEFIADKIREEKQKEYESILHIIGVQTGYQKGERMTDDEVHTYNAEASAYVSVLMQTFNDAAETQGAPFRVALTAARAISQQTKPRDGGDEPDEDKKEEETGK